MNYRTVARRQWPNAAWILGKGPYALTATCTVTTVSLHPTRAEAHTAKARLDRTGCGHACQRNHHITNLAEHRNPEGRHHTCPTCGAQPGQPCRTATGNTISHAHVARRNTNTTGPALTRTGQPSRRHKYTPDRKPYNVPCPTCGAPTGHRCKTPTGRSTDPHGARHRQAGTR